jgi:hypothetical protein|nr:hypothetical protein [Kofleriaceae bacterium]
MRSLVVALVLAGSSTAFAQAPGDTDVAPAGPMPAQPVLVVAAPDVVPVMAHRLSVGLDVGGVGLTPKGATQATSFGLGELAIRYRLGRHLELSVSAGGGQQQLPDGTQGDLQVSEGVLGARWYFRPEHRWNWFVSGGFGGLAVADKAATDQDRSDATRPLGELGIGVARRWNHLAIDAEFRAIGVGATKASTDDMVAPASKSTGTGTGTTMPTSSGDLSNSDPSASGAQLTIGAAYYF